VSEASISVFKLKKSDIRETVVPARAYTWTCPICNKIISSYYRDKALAAAKLHLERTHKLKVEVE